MSQGRRFVDQVVFITGAARGQGRAHALAFAREGASLLLCDTRRAYPSVPYALSASEELEAVAREIATLGQPVIARHVDVTDLAGMQRLLDEARSELGPVSIAIANAGLYSFGSTWELSEQQWDDTLAVVLKGAWITCKVAIPHMLAQRRGKIICIGSTGSFKGLPGLGHYVAAKHGVIGLVKTLAIELASYNINVNAICPTTVDTGIVNNQAFFEYLPGSWPARHARGCDPAHECHESAARARSAGSRGDQPSCAVAGFGGGTAYHRLHIAGGCRLFNTLARIDCAERRETFLHIVPRCLLCLLSHEMLFFVPGLCYTRGADQWARAFLCCMTHEDSVKQDPSCASASHRRAWKRGSTMREFAILTFGRFTLCRAEQEIAPPQRNGDLLCKLLLCQPNRRADASWLAEQLWPLSEGDQAIQYLYAAARSFRAVTASDLLVTHRQTQSYQLAGQDRLWVDADAALSLVAEAEAVGIATAEALPLFEQAVQYFRRGRFLAGIEEPWVQARRMHLEMMKERALVRLAEAYGQQGQHIQAQTLLSEALAQDPTNENLLCHLMETLHEGGMTHQALRAYDTFVKALRRTGLEPAEATTDLYERLKRAPRVPISLRCRCLRPSLCHPLPLPSSTRSMLLKRERQPSLS